MSVIVKRFLKILQTTSSSKQRQKNSLNRKKRKKKIEESIVRVKSFHKLSLTGTQNFNRSRNYVIPIFIRRDPAEVSACLSSAKIFFFENAWAGKTVDNAARLDLITDQFDAIFIKPEIVPFDCEFNCLSTFLCCNTRDIRALQHKNRVSETDKNLIRNMKHGDSWNTKL